MGVEFSLIIIQNFTKYHLSAPSLQRSSAGCKCDDDMLCAAVLIHFIDLHVLPMYLMETNRTLLNKIAYKLSLKTRIHFKIKYDVLR